MSFIEIEKRGRIVTFTLNNPTKVNCLPNALLLELIDAFDTLNGTEIVILKAEENNHGIWSAGFDATELPQNGTSPLYYDDPLERAIHKIIDYQHLVIACVNGRVLGGACELVCSCDVVIGTQDVSFQLTPVKLGIPYNLDGIGHIAQKTSNGFARFMLLTAYQIDADWAQRVGLLHMIIPAQDIYAFTDDFAFQMLSNSSLCINTSKRLMKVLDENDFSINTRVYEHSAQFRRDVYNPSDPRHSDYVEGLAAFKEKRVPNFPSNTLEK